MQRELELPDVGEGIAEGEIVRWLVEPGDRVTEDQPLAEVETDKAVVEVPSPITGTVESLHAEPGEVVAVGSVIVTFEVDDAAPSDGEQTATDDGATGSESPETRQAAEEPDQGDGTATDAAATPDRSVDGADGAVPASQIIAPPRVKRLARELGVAIGALDGAADGVPITEADVRRAAGEGAASTPASPQESSPAEPTAAAASPAQPQVSDAPSDAVEQSVSGGASVSASEAADREKTLAAPATRQLARELGVDIDAVPASAEREGQPFVTQADVEAFDGDSGTARPASPAGAGGGSAVTSGQREERVPYRGVRRTIGQRMEQAKYTAPHVAHHDSVDVSALAAARQDLSGELADDVSLTYLPFVMKAVVAALQDHPAMNSTLDEQNEEIVRKQYYNIGVATATDAGLMVPVIEDVDRKGVAQLAREIDDVVGRARTREISPEEMQGGTFTITNFGAIGGDHATPIINYPEAAILGLGAIKDRPVVVDDDVVARPTLPLSLSVDHRLIDGAVAASFTNDVKRSLNNPTRMLLW